MQHHVNFGWPTLQITAVSCQICSKQKIKYMAEIEDQNSSEIKPVLSHHSSERIPQPSLSFYCCSYVYCWVTTVICSESAFTPFFKNGYMKQQISSPSNETTSSQHVKITARISFISYKMYQNKFHKLTKKWSRNEASNKSSIIKPIGRSYIFRQY